MQQMHQKLKSNGGAAIIIALLFFLICLTVSVSVLAAAKANASRTMTQWDREQTYLTVRSAAMLMRDTLETQQNQPFATKTETISNGGEPVAEGSAQLSDPADTSMLAPVKQALLHFLTTSDTTAQEITYQIQLDGSAIQDIVPVAVTVKIVSISPNTETQKTYRLTANFALADAETQKTNYYMTLTETITVTITSATQPGESEGTQQKTTSYTMACSSGKLSLGKQESGGGA